MLIGMVAGGGSSAFLFTVTLMGKGAGGIGKRDAALLASCVDENGSAGTAWL
jgi:hypothetical protein